MRPAIALLALAAALPGCGEEVAFADAVWSDDGEEILVFVTHGDQLDGPHDTSSTRNVRHTLWRQDVSTGEMSRWRGEEPGSVIQGFFMRSAGYVLLNVSHGVGDRRAVRIGLDGDVRSAPISGEIHVSPDGAMVAVMETDCTRREGFTSDCVKRNRFLDGDTLEEIGVSGDIEFEDDTVHLDRIHANTWHPDGTVVYTRLFFLGPGMSAGPTFTLAPGAEPVEVSTPDCDPLYPKTSSSEVSRDGTIVRASWRDGRPFVDFVEGDEPGWPLRCFPDS